MSAETARRKEPYCCLECDTPVGLRAGQIRVKHFYHLTPSDCKGEGVIHKAAKLRLKEIFEDSLQGGPLPRLIVQCASLRSYRIPKGCERVMRNSVNYRFTSVAEEVTVSPYRLDVALLDQEQVTFGIEVFHQHRVQALKAATLNVPWIEVDATAVLNDALQLVPLSSSLDLELCLRCQSRDPAEVPTFVATLPPSAKPCDIITRCVTLSLNLKAFLRPARCFFDPTPKHLYLLFSSNHTYHLDQLLKNLSDLRVHLEIAFGKVSLAIGIRDKDGHTFEVYELKEPPREPEKVGLEAGPTTIMGHQQDMAEARTLYPEFIQFYVGEKLLERIRRCKVYVHAKKKTIWVVAPHAAAFQELMRDHNDELQTFVQGVFQGEGTLHLVVMNVEEHLLTLV